MKHKIYATYPLPEEVKQFLAEHCEIEQWSGEGRMPREALLREINDVEGLYTAGGTMMGTIDQELLDQAPQLKVVSNVSVGYNNFDVEAMKKRGVIGTHTPYVLDETVADLAFGLLLATARRIPELDRFVKEGNWKQETKYSDTYGKDVHGSTLGIIGMGRIGEAIAKRARFGFDMDLLYYNRNRKPEAEKKYDAEYCDLASLLQRSDFVLLMTPLTSETYQLIGKEEFSLMKKSAMFINVSRGQTIDEQALVEALQTGEIAAAGLDVFEQEPVQPDHPLLKMPNVVTIPHIGSATAQTELTMAMRAAENLVAVLQGKEALNPVR